MNWKRGLFRAWLLLTVLWFALFTAIMRPDQLASTYWENYQAVADQSETLSTSGNEADQPMHTYLITLLSGKKYLIAGETAEGANATLKKFLDNRFLDFAQFEIEASDAITGEVSELQPWQLHQLQQEALEHARQRQSLEETKSKFVVFALVGTVPPAILFVFGAVLFWVLRGFRAQSGR